MSALQELVQDGWARHADQPQAVAELLATAWPLLATEQDVTALAGLAHHVFGEHLAQWEPGLSYLRSLQAHALCRGEAAATCRRCRASLLLGQGRSDMRSELGESDRIRVTAMAAASIAGHDTPRALALLQEALDTAAVAALTDDDPVHRALAVTCNNLAATLEEQASRTTGERELMIRAAEAARRHWALAGGWLQVERAEHRLAHTWLKAGDPARARQHAQACLAIVAEQGDVPLERFFGHEVLALAARALGDDSAFDGALAAMRSAFGALAEGDRAWCASTLDAITLHAGRH